MPGLPVRCAWEDLTFEIFGTQSTDHACHGFACSPRDPVITAVAQDKRQRNWLCEGKPLRDTASRLLDKAKIESSSLLVASI